MRGVRNVVVVGRVRCQHSPDQTCGFSVRRVWCSRSLSDCVLRGRVAHVDEVRASGRSPASAETRDAAKAAISCASPTRVG